jgi:RNA polymerase sigma-70 factor (ECF subfamily)
MYLFRAISNEASSVRRTRARRQVVRLNAIDAPSYMMDPVDEVLEIVWELPVRQRAATYLVYWLEFTPTEAAEAMGCRPGTVRRYLHLARTRLKEALDELNP